MSRALGAAFLNHQVQQLEKTVTDAGQGGNWRDRRTQTGGDNSDGKRSRAPAQAKPIERRDGDATFTDGDKARQGRDRREQKDADIVVVDASVLIHALGQVKKWCRDGREEIIIVPLEALNTLDLLKKGMSSLAQRARAASRILEAQVGTNPRIRLQRDDAFVLWENIFEQQPPTGAPEWVRRTICCARWEIEHAAEEKPLRNPQDTTPPHVILAVLSQSTEAQSEAVFPPLAHVSASPVPLPAPQMNRHEPRSSGALVAQWAAKARIEVLEVVPAPLGAHPEERGKRGTRRNSRGAGPAGARPIPGGGLVERPPAVMAMMEMVAQPSRVVRVLARGEKLEPDT
ncbi:hypothetical protein POSPLADRAFT_1169571 [Postia placenta MAD-698-R-SB12]|uniref:PIN domain-containing protein n=1 Tax=Postia placenta MAD-698-R-SB12 TaxID=670580 RepID=A0A1X6N2V1_9APHY|nr:hypothetical protein POSPLADRAFT_1169571 [Postia placenta MAD-698-R-SB12]OSX62957.1 hypothetical protein POSPLADRAFT_1169571 [Postia placenta MAD-698-R-SB12]